jgi:hypothetical protein
MQLPYLLLAASSRLARLNSSLVFHAGKEPIRVKCLVGECELSDPTCELYEAPAFHFSMLFSGPISSTQRSNTEQWGNELCYGCLNRCKTGCAGQAIELGAVR